MIEKCLQRGCKSEENVLDLSITMYKIRIFYSVALKMCFWYFRQAQPEATGGGLQISVVFISSMIESNCMITLDAFDWNFCDRCSL